MSWPDKKNLSVVEIGHLISDFTFTHQRLTGFHIFYLGIEQAIYDYDYEALEDIWLKAGEMEPSDATFTTDEGYGSR